MMVLTNCTEERMNKKLSERLDSSSLDGILLESSFHAP
jgi:hypothetical protein